MWTLFDSEAKLWYYGNTFNNMSREVKEMKRTSEAQENDLIPGQKRHKTYSRLSKTMVWGIFVSLGIGLLSGVKVLIDIINTGVSTTSATTAIVPTVVITVVTVIVFGTLAVAFTCKADNEDFWGDEALPLAFISIFGGGLVALALCGLTYIASVPYSYVVHSSEDVVTEKMETLGYENVNVVEGSTAKKNAVESFTETESDVLSVYGNQVAYGEKNGKSYKVLIGFTSDKKMYVQQEAPVKSVNYAD